jgi:hypothetical protein
MKPTTLITLGLLAGSTVFAAEIPLLENADFSNGATGWVAGSNQFGAGGTYIGFALLEASERVQASGSGNTFLSWDDGTSDKIENFLFQEFRAGRAGEPFANEIFEDGDQIVFKGRASATLTGANTSDIVVRAFIKTLGYLNNQAFSIFTDYTQFQPLTGSLTDFDLSVVIDLPEVNAENEFQVIQLGFEITTAFDGTAMDTGTIYFENLEGYIVREGGGMTWAGYNVDENGWANTESWLGWINAAQAPWIQILSLDNYGYIEESGVTDSGSWMYILKK